jgi:hypothetical protein
VGKWGGKGGLTCRRRQNQSNRSKAERATTPPTVPPTIAPIFVFELDVSFWTVGTVLGVSNMVVKVLLPFDEIWVTV